MLRFDIKYKEAAEYPFVVISYDELQGKDLSGEDVLIEIASRPNRTEDIIAPNGNREFLRLSQLLTRTEGKLRSFSFGAVRSDVSPEFLTLLIAACRKANAVRLTYCVMTDAVCGCLMSSMMNPDGMTALNIELGDRNHTVSVHQARLLFHGIASSPSLQKLTLRKFILEDMDDSVAALGQALKTNQSLKSFTLYSIHDGGNDSLENIVRAAAGSATVETLNIDFHCSFDGIQRLPLSILQECLCRETCSVETLTLNGMEMLGDLDDNIMRRNSRLTNLALPVRSDLSIAQAVKFAKCFSSLTRLRVGIDRSSQLAPLDELLLGEESKLQDLKLTVVEREISMTQHWIEFFQKLPRMKTLTSLDIPSRIFRSESCRNAFLDGLQRNNTLTSIMLSSFFINEEHEPSFDDFYCKMSYLLSLNKLGRRYLQHGPSGQPLAANLWPHVLERAMRMKYISDHDKSKYPKLESLKIDAVYWLVREKLFTILESA